MEAVASAWSAEWRHTTPVAQATSMMGVVVAAVDDKFINEYVKDFLQNSFPFTHLSNLVTVVL